MIQLSFPPVAGQQFISSVFFFPNGGWSEHTVHPDAVHQSFHILVLPDMERMLGEGIDLADRNTMDFLLTGIVLVIR